MKDYILIASGGILHPPLNCMMKSLTRDYAICRAQDMAETLVKAGYSAFRLFAGDHYVCEIRVTTTIKSEVFE